MAAPVKLLRGSLEPGGTWGQQADSGGQGTTPVECCRSEAHSTCGVSWAAVVLSTV